VELSKNEDGCDEIIIPQAFPNPVVYSDTKKAIFPIEEFFSEKT